MKESIRIWTTTELIQADLPIPHGLLGGTFLVPGTLAVISGESGIGKTFLTSFLGDAVATGTPFAGMVTTQAHVLYGSEELSDAEYRQRLIGMRLASTNGHFLPFFQSEMKINRIQDRRGLYRLIRAADARLVIIDSLSRVLSPGLVNNNEAILDIFGNLEHQITRPLDCCILFVHHAGKADRENPNDLRGAQAIQDYPRDVIVVRRMADGLRSFAFKKATFGIEPPPMYFTLSQDLSGKTSLAFQPR